MNFSTTIEFKSLPEFFEKEVSGIKNNTVRLVDSVEDKKILSMRDNIKYIRIINTDNKECYSLFVRTITDITRWVMPDAFTVIYIFTWEK